MQIFRTASTLLNYLSDSVSRLASFALERPTHTQHIDGEYSSGPCWSSSTDASRQHQSATDHHILGWRVFAENFFSSERNSSFDEPTSLGANFSLFVGYLFNDSTRNTGYKKKMYCFSLTLLDWSVLSIHDFIYNKTSQSTSMIDRISLLSWVLLSTRCEASSNRNDLLARWNRLNACNKLIALSFSVIL